MILLSNFIVLHSALNYHYVKSAFSQLFICLLSLFIIILVVTSVLLHTAE